MSTNEEIAARIEKLAQEIKAHGGLADLLESMAWTAARIAHSAQLEPTPGHKNDLCHVRDHLQSIAVIIRQEDRERSRMVDALERIKALKDGYAGGNDERSEGRKAGYKVCGELAEVGLGLIQRES